MSVTKSLLSAFILANCLFVAMSFVARRAGLDYHFSTLIGRPSDPYGFQNLVLPRLVRHLLVLTPSGLAAVAVYRALRNKTLQFSISSLLVATVLVAVPFALGAGSQTNIRPVRAMLFVLYLVALSIVLTCVLVCRRKRRH